MHFHIVMVRGRFHVLGPAYEGATYEVSYGAYTTAVEAQRRLREMTEDEDLRFTEADLRRAVKGACEAVDWTAENQPPDLLGREILSRLHEITHGKTT